jgi:hypothetical protein
VLNLKLFEKFQEDERGSGVGPKTLALLYVASGLVEIAKAIRELRNVLLQSVKAGD